MGYAITVPPSKSVGIRFSRISSAILEIIQVHVKLEIHIQSNFLSFQQGTEKVLGFFP